MQVTWGKIVSLVIAIGYVVTFLLCVDGDSALYVFKLLAGLVFPLGFIWFPDELGKYTGFFGSDNYIDSETPSIIVSIIGWFFLVGFPLLIFLCITFG